MQPRERLRSVTRTVKRRIAHGQSWALGVLRPGLPLRIVIRYGDRGSTHPHPRRRARGRVRASAAKAVAGDTFQVSAIAHQRGPGVLRGCASGDPDGRVGPLVRMQARARAGDGPRWRDVVADEVWHFRVESWSDPIAAWQHDAGPRSRAGRTSSSCWPRGRCCSSGRPGRSSSRRGQPARPRRARRSTRSPGGCATAACRPGTGSQRRRPRRSPPSWPSTRCATW